MHLSCRQIQKASQRADQNYLQVNSTLNDYHFLHDCTGHARPFEISFAGSQLTMLNGNLGYMSFTNCDQLYIHGPVDLDFETSQLPITQV